MSDFVLKINNYQFFVKDLNTYKFGITENNYLDISAYNGFSFDDETIKKLLEMSNNSLSLKSRSVELIDKIPSSIINLAIDFPSYDDININALHIGLKKLYITSEAGGDFNNPIDNLPYTLEDLYIVSITFNQSLDFLPHSLTSLHIESLCFTHSVSNLPPNLLNLTIIPPRFYRKLEFTKDNFLNLPENLKILNVSAKFNLDINAIQNKYPNLKIKVC